VYRCATRHGEPVSDQPGWCSAGRGVHADAFRLTPLARIERLAVLGSPLRARRHHGVLAPNPSLKTVATALAPGQGAGLVHAGAMQVEPVAVLGTGQALGVVAAAVDGGAAGPCGCATWGHEARARTAQAPSASPLGGADRAYRSGMSLPRPICGAQMRVAAYIAPSSDVQQMLEHIRGHAEPPPLALARGPPLERLRHAQRPKRAASVRQG